MMIIRSDCSHLQCLVLFPTIVLLEICCFVVAFQNPAVIIVNHHASPLPVTTSGAAATKAIRKEFLHLYAREKSKWDDLVDEDDEDDSEVDDIIQAFLDSIPRDMRYVPRVVAKQNQNFQAIRDVGGKELTNDVYIQEPENDEVFWFVGKVARISDVTLEQAIARQYPLIEMHGSSLRPIELFPHRGKLQIWVAPGDSELEVAYNRPNIVFERMNREVESGDSSNIKVNMVGFQGEVYEGSIHMGFRTWRNPETGLAAKPEVQTPSTDDDDDEDEEEYTEKTYKTPTMEEMKDLQDYIKSQDIGEIYKEQQRRDKEAS